MDRTKGPLWGICGYVYNDSHRAATRVELLVEALDGAGGIVSSHPHHAARDVLRARGRSLFCVPVTAGAVAFRIRVTAVEWGYHDAP